jgi:hypothetical protein
VGVTAHEWTFDYGDEPVVIKDSLFMFDFRRPGTYTVTLLIEDAEGNTGTDTVIVNVTPIEEQWNPLSLIILLIIAVSVAIAWWRMRQREGDARSDGP